ncbi:MAG: GntR family transcriptional regulator [Bacillota bacterium]
MMTILERHTGENNRDFAYRTVKQAIMTLELEPGQPISEIDIAEQLGISRTPIREVIAKLKEEYLVEVTPQVGTYVSKIQPQLVEEAVFTRATLERELLKLACEDFPEDILTELKISLMRQEQLFKQQGTEQQFHELDKEFHYLIFKGVKKEHVWGAITRLSTHYNRIRLLSEIEFSFENALKQHKRIVEIIDTKALSLVNPMIDEHILAPTKQWHKLYEDESEFSHYFDNAYKSPGFI